MFSCCRKYPEEKKGFGFRHLLFPYLDRLYKRKIMKSFPRFF